MRKGSSKIRDVKSLKRAVLYRFCIDFLKIKISVLSFYAKYPIIGINVVT